MRWRGRNFRQVFNHPAVAILPYLSDTRFTRQLSIKAFFHPFNALPVNIGEANQIGRHVACRVKTARFITQVNSRQIQFINPFGLRRINLTSQVNEPAPGIGVNARREGIQGEMKRARQRLPAIVKTNAPFCEYRFRVGPYGSDGHADRQRSAFTIRDHPSWSINRQLTQRSHIFLLHQVVWFDDL